MTDRIRLLTVVLDRDYRTDDVQQIVTTICMVRGVESVVHGEPVDPRDFTAREVVRLELEKKLFEVLKKK